MNNIRELSDNELSKFGMLDEINASILVKITCVYSFGRQYRFNPLQWKNYFDPIGKTI